MGVRTIFGPPGTGKTTTLARLIHDAVDAHGSDRVIVASLTKTAAAEIKGRDLDVDAGHVGTLHAICKRALFPERKVLDSKRNGGLLAAFNAQYARSVSASAGDADDPYGDEVTAPSTESDALKEQMQLLRMRMIPRELWPASVQMFATEWEAWKAHTGTVDFTDMIERAYQLGGACPGDPAAIFYDEAQDGSALELSLIKQWAQHAQSTVVAGDDDQCLFSWRGASVKDFLEMSDETQREVLGHSYRLPVAVHAHAEGWVRRIKVRQPKEYDARPATGWVQSRSWCLEYPEEWIGEVEAHLAAGKSVMLLTTCAYMLNAVSAFLRQRGTPFHNPYRPRSAWNPVSGTAKRVLAYLSPPWTWQTLHAWTEHVRAEVMPHGAKSRIAEHAKQDDPEIVPWGVTKDLVPPALLTGDLPALEAALLDSHRGKYPYLLRVGPEKLRTHIAEVQGRPGRGLILGTVHSVKGGEADVVYLWPELSPSGYADYMSTGRDSVLRVMYVGMTRAKEGLVLCHPRSERSVEW